MLTERKKRFALEYMKDANATQAAIRAGYSKRSAVSQGNRLMGDVDISALIRKERERHKSESIATADEIMQYLTSVVRGESRSEVVTVEMIGDGCSEARKIQKAPDEKERIRAAETLAKLFGIGRQTKLSEMEQKARIAKMKKETVRIERDLNGGTGQINEDLSALLQLVRKGVGDDQVQS